jgi:hypothetical protein
MRKNIWPRTSFKNRKTYMTFRKPLTKVLATIPIPGSKGNKPYTMTMEHFLDSLIYYHLDVPDSGRHLLQALEQDSFAREMIAPPEGIKKSSFFEAMHSRRLEFFIQVYNALTAQATGILPKEHEELGELKAIDGSLIDAVLSMTWADYRENSKKAKVHVGFDLNHSIPASLTLTSGKGDEHKEVKHLISPGQTGIFDRYYQCHKDFDSWQEQGIHFVCRIRKSAKKTIIKENTLIPGSIVFYDSIVILGSNEKNITMKPVRVIAYRIMNKTYWVATDRFDLSAEQIAHIFHLRWKIEIFFGWWKRHLKVYHLIARSQHALMIQLLAGLITYLLLAIYCHEKFKDKVSIQRVRQLRIAIRNDERSFLTVPFLPSYRKFLSLYQAYAKT